MIEFFVKRPIAVIMVFLSVIVPGFLALLNLPVTLMPEIEIPQIKVIVSYPQALSREIENNVTRQLRTKLLQTANIENIQSESENGQAVLNLNFKYGTDIKLAYIECNEKIDAAIHFLPKDMERPIVVKAAASDIPIFSLNLSQKQENTENNFLELSEFARMVVKRRLEQIPEIAFVDITGFSEPEIQIIPDRNAMNQYGIQISDIENTLAINNINYGSLSLISGQYSYIVQFQNKLKNLSDIENINLKIDERVIKLKTIAQIKQATAKRNGLFLQNKKQAISMRVIMQNKAQVSKLEEKVNQSIESFRNQYPDLQFKISQDNSQLLKYSINNLSQTLFLGILLSFIFMFLFLGNLKLSFIAGISIPTALLISFLLFYLLGISINIISLSGLILGVGLMIDNAIIVIDNISGHRKNNDLTAACIIGTNEIIRPLLSSVLTTIAVFFPLIFLSGISGALFYDQAIAVSLGLISSFIVSISLLPVLFNLFITSKTKFANYTRTISLLYEKGFELSFRYKKSFLFLFLVLGLFSIFLFQKIEKKEMPKLKETDFILTANWNENISLHESEKRISKLLGKIENKLETSNTYLARQQFLFNKDERQSFNEFSIYLKLAKHKSIISLQKEISKILRENYPFIQLSFKKSKNAFEYIFPNKKNNLIVEIISAKKTASLSIKEFDFIFASIKKLKNYSSISKPDIENFYQLKILPEKCLLYHINETKLYQNIQSLLESVEIASLKSLNNYVPIVIKSENTNLYKQIQSSFILNQEKENIPISKLITIEEKSSFKKIFANNSSEYLPIKITSRHSEELIREIKKLSSKDANFYLNFSGSFFSTQIMLKELLWVLLISMALLYFILAAQFESVILPLLVLIELPIDITGALLFLYLGGFSLNLMSAIGMVVMSGIIINDSILKLDAIIQYRNEAYSLMKAIKIGGEKRLKSILMTSLTTIFALIPLLFFTGIGADLQKPFALSIIGGLSIGTLVSLYLIPLLFWFTEKIKNKFKH